MLSPRRALLPTAYPIISGPSDCQAPRAVEKRPAIGILSVSPVREDHRALRRLLSGKACRIATAHTCRTALRRLRRNGISIVVCERDLPDGAWRDVLNYISASSGAPLLIVTSKAADERLWAEVINLGGFDVIAKPFDAREAGHVLETACLGRRGVLRTAGAA